MGKLTTISSDKKALSILFLFLSIFYLPLWSGLLAIKNDSVTIDYIQKISASYQLQNGELPLWNPYWGLGTPTNHLIIWSSYNPVHLFFSSLPNYRLHFLQLELFFYILIGAVGFYYFIKSVFQTNSKLALLGSLLFSLCANTLLALQYPQNLYAYMMFPWLLYSCFSFLQKPNVRTSIFFSICCFYSINNAYVTVSIFNSFLVASIFLLYLIKNRSVLYTTKVVIYLLPTVLLLALPAFFTYEFLNNSSWNIGEYRDRGILTSSYKMIPTLVNPFVQQHGNLQNIIGNHYLGLTPILLSFILFFKYFNKKYIWLLVLLLLFFFLQIEEFIGPKLLASVLLLDQVKNYYNLRLYILVVLIVFILSQLKKPLDRTTVKLFFRLTIIANLCFFCYTAFYAHYHKKELVFSYFYFFSIWSILLLFAFFIIHKKMFTSKNLLIFGFVEVVSFSLYLFVFFGFTKKYDAHEFDNLYGPSETYIRTNRVESITSRSYEKTLKHMLNGNILVCDFNRPFYYPAGEKFCDEVLVESKSYQLLQRFNKNSGGQVVVLPNSTIQNIKLSTVQKQSDTVQLLLQSSKDWMIRVNERPAELIDNEKQLLQFIVPKGKVSVQLSYKPRLEIISIYLHYALLLLYGVIFLVGKKLCDKF